MLDKNKAVAFCVFAKKLYVAWGGGAAILPIENNRLETVLFDALSSLQLSAVRDIIISAGPAPFTQLRILRATQLGLATGLRCAAPLVNMFDVLFFAAGIKTGSCLLETRRGDYFLQTRVDGKIVDEGVSNGIILGNEIISDDPKLSTVEITQNLAKIMLENNLKSCEELIYGLQLPY